MSFFEKESRILNKVREKAKGDYVDPFIAQQGIQKANQRIAVERIREEFNAQEKAAIDSEMAKKVKSIALKAVKNNPSMSEQQKEDVVVKNQNEDDKDIDQLAKNKNNTQDSKEIEDPTTPASQFKQALTFFAPQLLGGAIAGAFEGEEGFVAGYKAGGGARDSFIDYQRENQNLGAQAKIDITPDFEDKETGEPRWIRKNPQTGLPEIIDMSGNLQKPNSVIRSDLKRQREREFGIGQRYKGNMEFMQEKFGFNKQKAAQLSDKQQEQLANYGKSLESLDRIDNLFKDAETGPILGRVQTLGEFADAAPEEFTKLKVEINNLRLGYQKAISGAQVNETEMALIKSIIPTQTDAPGVFKAKIDSFKEIMASHREAFVESISTGQPLKKSVVEDLKARAREIQNNSAPQKPKANKGLKRQAYNQAIKNAKSKEEIDKIIKQYGAR